MEKKVSIIFIVAVILTVIIYSFFDNQKLNFMAIGDSSAEGFNNLIINDKEKYLKDYNTDYVLNNLSSDQLLDFLINNTKLGDNNLTIKQLIAKADILTISLGMDELSNNQNIKLYLYYMDKILEEITKINNKEINLFSLYTENIRIKDINNKLNDLATKYNINFINIENEIKEEHLYEGTHSINSEGNKLIKEKYTKEVNNT